MQVFNVAGMSCGHCVKSITQAIQAADPQANVVVDLASKQVQVESSLAAPQVAELINQAGYSAQAASA